MELEGVRGFGLGGLGFIKLQYTLLNFSVLCLARGAQGSSGRRRPEIVAVAIVAAGAG